MPAGRPTKYVHEMASMVSEYLSKYEEDGHVIPTLAGLSLHLHVSRETINQWGKDEDKPEFSDAIEGLKAEQEIKLFAGGLTGQYNSTIAKLGLHGHGHSDKQTTDLNIDLEKLSTEQLEALANGKSLA